MSEDGRSAKQALLQEETAIVSFVPRSYSIGLKFMYHHQPLVVDVGEGMEPAYNAKDDQRYVVERM